MACPTFCACPDGVVANRFEDALCAIELAGVAIEVRARRRGHAVRALAEEHEVEVGLEDVALGPPPLERARQQRLADLAPHVARAADLGGSREPI